MLPPDLDERGGSLTAAHGGPDAIGADICAAMSNFLVMEYHAHDVPWWGSLVDGEPPITQGFIHLRDNVAGHGMTLNEDVAKAHLKPGTSYFGDVPYACA